MLTYFQRGRKTGCKRERLAEKERIIGAGERDESKYKECEDEAKRN